MDLNLGIYKVYMYMSKSKFFGVIDDIVMDE